MWNKGDDSTAKTLCKSCNHSVIKVLDNGDMTVKCTMDGSWVLRPVVKCNSFSDREYPDPSDLKKMAWEIDISQLQKQKIGFYRPGDPNRTIKNEPWEDL